MDAPTAVLLKCNRLKLMYATTVEIIRQIAPTACRRSEMIGLM